MPLTYNMKNIENWKLVCLDKSGEHAAPVTERIIWASMSVGLNEVKAGNVDEWMIRINMLNRVWPGQVDLTLTDVKAHIGLRTNAAPKTPTAFRKWVMVNLLDEATQEFRRQQREEG